MDLTINSDLVIPSKELKWRFSRSSGSGGQGVNTTDSRVELIFDINQSSVISSSLKERLLEQVQSRCTNGYLKVVATKERSQYKNRKLALERLKVLLRAGLSPPPKSRKMTKATFASQKRRITAKKHRSRLKEKRQRKPSIEE